MPGALDRDSRAVSKASPGSASSRHAPLVVHAGRSAASRRWYLSHIHCTSRRLAEEVPVARDGACRGDRFRNRRRAPRVSRTDPARTSFVAGCSWQKDHRTGAGRSSPERSRLSSATTLDRQHQCQAQLLIAARVFCAHWPLISPEAEARAIHWAVAHDAQVINISFVGVRDPSDPSQDTYSALEAAAVSYAGQPRRPGQIAFGQNADSAPRSNRGATRRPCCRFAPHAMSSERA